MSMIEGAGSSLEDSIMDIHHGAQLIHTARAQFADAQGILTGVALESEDPQLAEAITQYKRAIDELTVVMGCMATAAEKIGIVGSRIGLELPTFRFPERPDVYVTPIPERIPHEGDRGNTTAEQFDAYVAFERYIDMTVGEHNGPEGINGYLGDNGFCDLFLTGDGNIMKVPTERRTIYHDEHNPQQPGGIMWHIYTRALRRGRGKEGLEQFVAYIDDEGGWKRGAVICEPVPGNRLGRLSEGEVLAIPAEHLEQLMRTFQTMEECGLMHDVGEANILYNPQTGFTITNYWMYEEWQRFMSDSGDAVIPNKAEAMAGEFIRIQYDYPSRQAERYLDAFEKTFGKAAAEELRKKLQEPE